MNIFITILMLKKKKKIVDIFIIWKFKVQERKSKSCIIIINHNATQDQNKIIN